MNNEIWKPVKGFENAYEVSNMGRVRSLDRKVTFIKKGKVQQMDRKGQLLTPHKIGGNSRWNNNERQYLYVMLGNQSMRYVHRLVAEAFCERPDGCDEVNHINEDKTDNRSCNLMWVTHQENVMHSYYKCTGAGQKKLRGEEWHAKHDPYRNYVDKNKRIADGFANKNISNRWALEYYADYLSKDEKRYLNEDILKNIQLKKKYNAKAKISYKEYKEI